MEIERAYENVFVHPYDNWLTQPRRLVQLKPWNVRMATLTFHLQLYCRILIRQVKPDILKSKLSVCQRIVRISHDASTLVRSVRRQVHPFTPHLLIAGIQDLCRLVSFDLYFQCESCLYMDW